VAALTKTVDGKALPKEKFAMVGDAADISTWHLPVDEDHIDSALKMFGHETHGSAEQKATAARKIASAAREHGIDAGRVKDFESKYCKSDAHAEPDYSGGWIEIFRVGDYTAQGKAKVTRDDLTRVVNDYDPAFHEAPVCIGHPEDNLPAYAWVDRLKLNGDTLLAKEKDIDPQFAEMRRQGKFKKRSAAFYRDGDGKIAGLRHVGWLGAQPPAVKGLRDVAFDDHGKDHFEIEFEEETEVDKPIKEQIAEFFAEMFGKKQTASAATFSEDDVKRIVGEAVKPFESKVETLEGDLKSQTAKFAERESAIAQGEAKQVVAGAISRLKEKGCWLPAFDKMHLPEIFAEAAKSDKKYEFGEGDAKKTLSTLDMLTEFFEGLPQIVPSGRIVTHEPAAHRGAKTGDPLTDLAKARAAEKKISFSDALAQVAEENPELTVPGGGRAGTV
jgi:hypothetical protein